MELSKCYGFVKYALVCVNLIFWGVGLATVIQATWMLTDRTFLISLADEQRNFDAGLFILLAAGLLTLLVALLGCCGALRESSCMLVAFFGCLLVVIVAQIAAAGWLYANGDRLEELIRSSLINTVKNEYGEIESRTHTIDAFQSNLGCCGATGPSDWSTSKYARKESKLPLSLAVSNEQSVFRVPESCCRSSKEGEDKDDLATFCERNLRIGGIVGNDLHNEGCVDKLVDALKGQSSIVIGVAIAIACVEFLGLILSLILCCAIGSSDRYKA